MIVSSHLSHWPDPLSKAAGSLGLPSEGGSLGSIRRKATTRVKVKVWDFFFESYTQRRWERKNWMDLRLQSSDDGDLNTYSMMFGENDGSTTPYSLSDDGDLTHSMMAVNWGGAWAMGLCHLPHKAFPKPLERTISRKNTTYFLFR